MAWVVVPAWLQELLFFSLALLVCLVYLLAALLLELPVHQLPAMASLLLQCVQRAYKAKKVAQVVRAILKARSMQGV